MVVLGKAKQEGVRAEARAEVAEIEARRLPARVEEVRHFDLYAGLDDIVGEAELAVELQRARVDDEGARGLPRSRVLVDNAERNTVTREAQREDEAGRTGAHDQDLGRGHRALLRRHI